MLGNEIHQRLSEWLVNIEPCTDQVYFFRRMAEMLASTFDAKYCTIWDNNFVTGELVFRASSIPEIYGKGPHLINVEGTACGKPVENCDVTYHFQGDIDQLSFPQVQQAHEITHTVRLPIPATGDYQWINFVATLSFARKDWSSNTCAFKIPSRDSLAEKEDFAWLCHILGHATGVMLERQTHRINKIGAPYEDESYSEHLKRIIPIVSAETASRVHVFSFQPLSEELIIDHGSGDLKRIAPTLTKWIKSVKHTNSYHCYNSSKTSGANVSFLCIPINLNDPSSKVFILLESEDSYYGSVDLHTLHEFAQLLNNNIEIERRRPDHDYMQSLNLVASANEFSEVIDRLLSLVRTRVNGDSASIMFYPKGSKRIKLISSTRESAKISDWKSTLSKTRKHGYCIESINPRRGEGAFGGQESAKQRLSILLRSNTNHSDLAYIGPPLTGKQNDEEPTIGVLLIERFSNEKFQSTHLWELSRIPKLTQYAYELYLLNREPLAQKTSPSPDLFAPATGVLRLKYEQAQIRLKTVEQLKSISHRVKGSVVKLREEINCENPDRQKIESLSDMIERDSVQSCNLDFIRQKRNIDPLRCLKSLKTSPLTYTNLPVEIESRIPKGVFCVCSEMDLDLIFSVFHPNSDSANASRLLIRVREDLAFRFSENLVEHAIIIEFESVDGDPPNDENVQLWKYGEFPAPESETELNGWGLHVTNRIVKSVRGKMWLDSEVDQSAVFSIALYKSHS